MADLFATTYPRCATCRFWRPDPPRRGFVSPRAGRCERLSEANPFAGAEDRDAPRLRPNASFGCVLHRPHETVPAARAA